MFSGLMNKSVNINRLTDEILASTPLIAIAGVTYQPKNEFTLLAKISGNSAGGTISITGLVSGVTATESIHFNIGDKFKQTGYKFTSVSGLTQTGFTNGNIQLLLRTSGGGAGYTDIPYITNLRCRIEKTSERNIYAVPGTRIINAFTMYCIGGESILMSDIVSDGSSRYSVDEILPRETANRVHHREIGLSRI